MRNKEFENIISAIPQHPCQKIDWELLRSSVLEPLLLNMEIAMQNPRFHAEGSVLNHTKLVMDALVREKEFWDLEQGEKEILFLATLLHDIGKPKAHRIENGEVTTPKHAVYGAKIAREIMWKTLGLCGGKEEQNIRESVCALIRYHSAPPHILDNRDPQLKMLRIASLGELAPSFTLRKLYLLEKADALGRISTEKDDFLDRVEAFRMYAEELEVLDGPFKFKTPYTERAYFRGRTKWYDGELFCDTWGEVVVLCGLPGTGKDTWIAKNRKDTPVISLDAIRKELGIKPTDNQGKIINEATERARALLRKRTPFVFNATNITEDIRGKYISLFEEYGASVKTVFLETEWQEGLRRNSSRKEEVPQKVIESMLARLEVPQRHEAEKVIWEIS